MPAVRLEEANSAQLAGWSGRHTGRIPEPHYAVLVAGEQQPLLRWLQTRFQFQRWASSALQEAGWDLSR